ncbi:conserved hypothetical protein [Candidatus Sulfopaludibacter sp. SbA3]|nr:conserved hypothetical protein [Candidatus Sulfopaludibacter sp. SbA3]
MLVPAAGAAPRLRIELMPRSTLRGVVTDREGRPAAGVELELQRVRYPGSYSAKTDATGAYAFEDVRPTAYVVAAMAQDFTTFYPGFTDRRQAAPIVIPAGVELTGYDFHLQTGPVFRVRGTVIDATGRPVAGVALRLNSTALSAADGTFEFPRVPAGEWRIEAGYTPPQGDAKGEPDPAPGDAAVHPEVEATLLNTYDAGKDPAKALRDAAQAYRALSAYQKALASTQTASVPVIVSNCDVERVVVRLAPPFAVPMQCEPVKCSVRLEAVYDGFQFPEGSGLLESAYPGRYRIAASAEEPGYYAALVLLGGRDVTGQEVELAAGAPPIRVVLKNDTGSVRGTVDQGDHATVVLAPRNTALIHLDGLAKTRCGPNGRFELNGLRPGDYFAWAFQRLDAEALRDPEFLRSLARSAVAVPVRSGETMMLELAITPWPD